MGNPCFYYYPVVGGPLQTIDFGSLTLSDLVITPIRTVTDTISRAGAISRDVGGMRLQVQIVVERFDSISLVRQFRNMGNHLERGGAVGFTLDTAKLWAGFVSPIPVVQGAGALPTPGSNAWSTWSAGTLADNDPIVVQSAPPESVLEHHTMNGSLAATATGVNIDSTIENDPAQGPILVRYRDFWPCLKMPEDQVRLLADRGICQSHRRLNHTLDVVLVEDWSGIRSVANSGAPQMPTSDPGSSIRYPHFSLPTPTADIPNHYPTVHPYKSHL
mgnify:CR=1 FL=1